MNIYQVAEVASRLKISKQTLLRYEKKGILPKPRRNRINHWREYTEEDIKKLVQILDRGLSLIELIMVMVMLGILAALVIPRFESFYFIKFNGAMKKVISDIRYVQQFAISRHALSRIEFNTAGETYRACYCNEAAGNCTTGQCGQANWTDIIDPLTRQSLIMNFRTDPQYRGILIDTAAFGGSNILQFDWQGTPKDGNYTNLSVEGNARFVYRNGTISNRIYVSPRTGRISIQ